MILGIDTSTRIGALALFDEQKGLVAESRFGLSLAHSETLMPGIAAMLESADLALKDLSGIAVARGPGSFTGLRVALATVKGLTFSSTIPVYPVSTLEAMALPHAFASMPVCPMLEARKNEVYAALYDTGTGQLEPLVPEAALSPEVFLDRIQGPVMFLGEGALRHQTLIAGKLGTAARFAPASAFHPSALSVCELAVRMYVNGTTPVPDPETLTPTYLRASEAELKWKEKHST